MSDYRASLGSCRDRLRSELASGRCMSAAASTSVPSSGCGPGAKAAARHRADRVMVTSSSSRASSGSASTAVGWWCIHVSGPLKTEPPAMTRSAAATQACSTRRGSSNDSTPSIGALQDGMSRSVGHADKTFEEVARRVPARRTGTRPNFGLRTSNSQEQRTHRPTRMRSNSAPPRAMNPVTGRGRRSTAMDPDASQHQPGRTANRNGSA